MIKCLVCLTRASASYERYYRPSYCLPVMRHIRCDNSIITILVSRQGSTVSSAEQFVLQKDNITKFFEYRIDGSSNKLVLAVSIHIQNNWFELSCKLYSEIWKIIVFHLMYLSGIDFN